MLQEHNSLDPLRQTAILQTEVFHGLPLQVLAVDALFDYGAHAPVVLGVFFVELLHHFLDAVLFEFEVRLFDTSTRHQELLHQVGRGHILVCDCANSPFLFFLFHSLRFRCTHLTNHILVVHVKSVIAPIVLSFFEVLSHRVLCKSFIIAILTASFGHVSMRVFLKAGASRVCLREGHGICLADLLSHILGRSLHTSPVVSFDDVLGRDVQLLLVVA